ncbi:MAG: hypothetical protein DSY47_02215 [Hydrogenothermus sp.]|nr:MAG: hypothetical protein DSY47_02215 [Hydrogenothermus sp.]
MKNRKCYFFFFFFFIFIILFTNFYIKDILLFEAKLRNFIKNGKFTIRDINKDGIPISFSPKIGKYISPFYVVNYGIYYSEILREKNIITPQNPNLCWKEDESLKYWYFPINKDKVTLRYFKNTADWIVNNLQMINGKAHLIYRFNWPYPKYRYKFIKAPWWSGLTDGYAIILLIRAYDIFKEPKYLITATKLYKSVIYPVDKGGSLTKLNNFLWIEEYVDPLHPLETPKVLNGMIYSFYGVKCYEEKFNVPINLQFSEKLVQSIEKNIKVFDKGFWSYYDAIKNTANIKYHLIHVALLKDLADNYQLKLTKTYNNWGIGAKFPILWIFYSDFSIAKLHFFIDVILIFIIIFGLLKFIICKRLL